MVAVVARLNWSPASVPRARVRLNAIPAQASQAALAANFRRAGQGQRGVLQVRDDPVR